MHSLLNTAKTLTRNPALCLVLLLAMPCAVSSQTRVVNATIDTSKTGAPISKNIYGQFLEHGGDIVNTGVWSELLVDRNEQVPDVEVTDHHTAVDYAHLLKELSDTHFPNVRRIRLVQDNLNTHRPASLYGAFPAAEARRLVERFDWHYTPKHGSWLNMAESELSVLSSQCLDRRIPDKDELRDEVAAWQADRNKHHAKADWQFTTDDARVKLKRLYPSL